MKKLVCLLLSLIIWVSLGIYFPQVHAWNRSSSPVEILTDVKNNANKNISNQVQNTDLDGVTSKYNECEQGIAAEYTLTRTLCYIKVNIKDYVQYLMYFWLTAATIILIWNGFQIVTSSDREKQIWVFKKNLTYIIVWVILLIWFYYIIDIFVSVVNLIVE